MRGECDAPWDRGPTFVRLAWHARCEANPSLKLRAGPDGTGADGGQLRGELGLRYRGIGWAGAGIGMESQRDGWYRRRGRAGMQAVSSAISGNIPCHRNSRARARLCFVRAGRKPKAGIWRGRSFPRGCEDLQGWRDGDGACVTECALGASFNRLGIALVDRVDGVF